LKLAFDECVPMGMVRVFQSLAKERHLRRAMGEFTIVLAKTYAPKPSDDDFIKDEDVPWLVRFAKDGGKFVISGDASMLDNPHEMLALANLGFVVVIFERRWSDWDFFRKSSLLLHYWRDISRAFRNSRPGTFWRVPGHWKENGELRDVSPGKQEISKTAPSAADREVPRDRKETRVRRKRSGIRQEAGKDSPPSPKRGEDPRQGRLAGILDGAKVRRRSSPT
jgi:hypothetical protein